MLDNHQSEIQLRVAKLKQREFEDLCERKLKQFYDNWYFYQTYKGKPHYYQPFNIVYK